MEYSQPRNITGLISVLLYQQCNISIVFSNEAGSSEPFILAFSKYSVNVCIIYHYYIDATPTTDSTPSPTGTDDAGTSSPGSIINRPGLPLYIKLNISYSFIVFIEIIGAIFGIAVLILVLLIIIIIVIIVIIVVKKKS